MESKLLEFSNPGRATTFTKNTNRKYFGGASDADSMKKSSILFTSPKQESFTGAPLSRLTGYTVAQEPTPTVSEVPVTRTKSNTMYSSMIVSKADSFRPQAGLASSEQYRELNDKADQLKKRLLQMADKKSPQQDLLNKYSKPAGQLGAPSVFSKNKKPQDDDYYSKDFTDFGKFGGLLNPARKDSDPTKAFSPQSGTMNTKYTGNDFAKKHMHSDSSREVPSTTTSFSGSALSGTPYTGSSPLSQPSQYNLAMSMKQQPKKIKKDDFEMGKKLGNGMFGQVFLVRHKTLGFVCAMKILKKEMVRQQKVQDQLVRQIKIQFYLQHQNVINLYGFFYDSECVYLLQQLCMDGHLFSMLKQKHRFEDPEAANIIKQICQGLDYIHRERIIHRDIKPQNIIMHQGVAKICDFGWSVYRGDGLRGTFCGTPLYTPPELLRGQMYDQKFDIWAIGILAYELIVGRFPFKIFCEDDIKRILTDEITFPFSVDVSPDAKNFILSIIRKDPRERIEIDEILYHPFLKNNSMSSFQIDFKL